MAEPSTSSSAASQTVAERTPPKKKLPLHQIYALPAPIRTFPLPTFYPSNPLSLVHVVYAWLNQTVFSRPPNEPSTRHRGTWSPETRSVHITDPESIRALWEQGFFGKGHLSRSEPNWLKREMDRRGVGAGKVAEQLTSKRREERQRVKWERARIEQEAIERTRLEETLAAAHAATAQGQAKLAAAPPLTAEVPTTDLSLPFETAVASPVGPLELLRLPNSGAEMHKPARASRPLTNRLALHLPPVTPLQLVRLPNSAVELQPSHSVNDLANGVEQALILDSDASPLDQSPSGSLDLLLASTASVPEDKVNGKAVLVNGNHGANGHGSIVTASTDGASKSLKGQKSVRFSPKVKSATFNLHDPPSPINPTMSLPQPAADLPMKLPSHSSDAPAAVSEASQPAKTADGATMVDREHLQLSAQEAFYLAFAIGALVVVDPKTGSELSTLELLQLFGDHSFFPPRNPSPDLPRLRPDDPFLVHYAAYHHFRSLGWVPREGVKFGVDWLLYRRGPVFDHAEFGLMVLPSYSDAGWSGQQRKAPQRQLSWHWLHGIQRVLSHVLKSMVLVYVDIPPPSAISAVPDAERGIAELLEQYRVREVMVRRWSSNRNR